MKDVYAIRFKDKWFLAKQADGSQYREPAGDKFWSQAGTTACLGPVGKEDQCVALDSDERVVAGDLYMRYLGVLSLLGEASAYLPKNCDVRDQIETALQDAHDTYGIGASRVLNRYDIEPGRKNT